MENVETQGCSSKKLKTVEYPVDITSLFYTLPILSSQEGRNVDYMYCMEQLLIQLDGSWGIVFSTSTVHVLKYSYIFNSNMFYGQRRKVELLV
jgi:hypothetical protein